MGNRRRLNIIISCIICAVLGSYSARLLFDHITNTQNISDTALKPRLVAAKSAAAAASVSLPLPSFPPPASPAAKGARKTSPTQAKIPPQPAFVLNGIVFSPGSSYALVNNKIVKEGDKIEGATVVRITEDSVELKDGDTAFKISPNARSF